MQVTFQGNPLTLEGTQVKVGDKAPDFTVLKNDLSPLSLKDMPGKKNHFRSSLSGYGSLRLGDEKIQ